MNWPNCNDEMSPTEAALHRLTSNALFSGFGSSVLHIFSQKKNRWADFMRPSRKASAFYCCECGSLLMAPTIKSYRKDLGFE